jgi:hypothetical protein
MLKHILKKQTVRVLTGFMWLVASFCEYDNGVKGSMEDRKFFD